MKHSLIQIVPNKLFNIKFLLKPAIVAVALSLSACLSQADSSALNDATSKGNNLQVATFAGGCFWCVEAEFEKLEGVSEVVSGFSGGSIKNPTYRQVASGSTRHIEAVQVFYDESIISYDELLYSFWRQINPTDDKGQFVDRGHQYKPAIFFHSLKQKMAAQRSTKALAATGRFDSPLKTDLTEFNAFYAAEEYHQDYYKKNPVRYKFYRYNSGRDKYLEKTWGDDLHKPYPSQRMKKGMQNNMNMPMKAQTSKAKQYSKPNDAQIKKMLTALQYDVTQEEGTERPYTNEYWDNKKEGIYVDIVSQEPLFSSLDKYDSKTGWPSFTRPLVSDNVKEETDFKLIYPRTEIRSRFGESHLGHVFSDGPEPTGLRYCINSAAMRFIAKADLEKEGYGEFVKLFK